MNLISAVQSFLAHYPNQKIMVALSGGSDSICLLHILSQYTNNIVAIHVNHGTRTECLKEEKFVGDFCAKMNISYVVAKPDQAISLSMSNFEQTARDVRYQFFEKYARREQCFLLVTAHHADDVYETIFLKLFRGMTTLFIPQERYLDREQSIKIIRPLLFVSKKDILSYLDEHFLLYLDDPSNKDTKYLRNFIRQDLIPLVSSRIPYWKKHLDSVIKERNEEEAFLANFVKHKEQQIFPNEECLIVNFLKEDAYIQKRILQNKCFQIFNHTFTTKQCNHIISIISNDSKTFAILYQDTYYQLIKEYRSIRFISKKTIENLEKNYIFMHNNIYMPINDWKIVFSDKGLSYNPEDVIYTRLFLKEDYIPWGEGSKRILQYLKDKN
ncbi:MAG: tRNA lysidine(34) synthetase TilS, partial [Brevinema sp.]